jgi:hypothetical protein
MVMAVSCPSVVGWAGVGVRIGLAVEGLDAGVVRVQVLAAGQAPGASRRLAGVAADPKPGRVLPAVDAQLDGVWQQAGRGDHAPPGRGGGGGPACAGRLHDRGCGQILDEPCRETAAAWPAGQVRGLALGRVCARLTGARWAGPPGQGTADAVHDGLLMELGRRGGGPSRLVRLVAVGVARDAVVD